MWVPLPKVVKNKVRQLIWDKLKWKTRTHNVGRRKYIGSESSLDALQLSKHKQAPS